jgi:hypothetical protein
MSAPNQGRQSPDPERQTGAQQGTTASGKHDQKSGQDNKETLAGLSSNPEHPLAKAAEEKTAKQ